MSLFRSAFRLLFRLLAGIVVGLALLVGLARLLLPEAASLTADIKAGVQAATGFTIDFDGISVGASLYGPELRLTGVTLYRADGEELLRVERLAVSVDVPDSLLYRTFDPGRILIVGADIDIGLSRDGEVTVQGRSWRELLPPSAAQRPDRLPDLRLQIEQVVFGFRNEQADGESVRGLVSELSGTLDDPLITFYADIEPGEALGKRLELEGSVPLELVLDPELPDSEARWSLTLIAEDFRLDPWLRLARLSDLPVIDTRGSIETGVEFRGRRPVSVQANIDLEDIDLAQPDDEAWRVDWLEGQLNWQVTADGWLASGKRFWMSRDGRAWPRSDFALNYGVSEGRQNVRGNATFLRLDDLMPFARAAVPAQLDDAGVTGSPAGDISNVRFSAVLADEKLSNFSVEADFAALGYVDPAGGFDLAGYTGSLEATQEGGNLRIETAGARFGVTKLFPETLSLDVLKGVGVWRASEAGYRVLANNIELVTPHGSGTASIELSLEPDFTQPVIDLDARARLDDASAARLYLPLVLPPKVLEWLSQAIIAGRVPRSDIRLAGPLKSFPFENGEGEFRVALDFEDGVLDYAPGWPLLSNGSGELVFEGPALYTRRNAFEIAGIPLRDVDLLIADLRKGVLTAKGQASADLVNVLGFLRDSPVGAALGPVFADVRAAGPATAELELLLPIRSLADWQFNARFSVARARLGLAGIEPEFTELSARGSVRNTAVTVDEGTATLLGEPVALTVTPADSPTLDYSHRADLTGDAQVAEVWDAFTLPPGNWLNGKARLNATAFFPTGRDSPQPFRMTFATDLEGVSSDLPYPLNKRAELDEDLQGEVRFPAAGRIELDGSLQRGYRWAIEFLRGDAGWRISRGVVNRADQTPTLPSGEGVTVTGYVDTLSLNDWAAAFSEPATPNRTVAVPTWPQLFTALDLQIGELFAVGHRFVDVDVTARPLETAWDVTVVSPWAEGMLRVPYRLTGPDPIELDLRRLLLIEPLASDENEADPDPRSLPGFRGVIDEFALQKLRFGRLDVDVERVNDGLRSRVLKTTSPSFRTDLSADWLSVDNAQRTRLHIDLWSTDVQRTLTELGYSPLISAERATVSADLLWEGGPGMAMIYESTGQVNLTIRDGIVNELDAGTGRLLGLLSVTALPRRLNLDFSEMTETGLVFDKIAGSFRIDFGNAWTCNLGLEGDVADMGIVGRTGILAEDYEQVAAVRPHVSNLAPVAGAFLAGPTVGVATLLVTQIFRKSLSGIGESYVTIRGSWDDPEVKSVSRDQLDTTPFGDCERQLPTLSPEEIAAIEGLISGEAPVADEPPPTTEQSASPQGQALE